MRQGVTLAVAALLFSGCLFANHPAPAPSSKRHANTRADTTAQATQSTRSAGTSGGYGCTTHRGSPCEEVRFSTDIKMRNPLRLHCGRHQLLAIGTNRTGDHRTEFTEVVSLDPSSGAVAWRRALTHLNKDWSHPQVTQNSSGHTIVAARGHAAKVIFSAGGKERAVVASFDRKGEPLFAALLDSNAAIVSQGQPKITTHDNDIYVALGERIQQDKHQKTVLALYHLRDNGRSVTRSQLHETHATSAQVETIAVGPDSTLWLVFRNRLIHTDRNGNVLDRYPLDPMRDNAGLVFEGQHNAIVASSTNGRDNGGNGHDVSDGRTRNIFWRAAPTKPLLQLAAYIRGKNTYKGSFGQAGTTNVIANPHTDHSLTLRTYDAQRGLEPAFTLSAAGHRWNWCNNGDMLLYHHGRLSRQPLFKRPLTVIEPAGHAR